MLPGEHERPIVPPQRFRLAIGEVYEKTYNGEKKSLPRKLDYWTVRELSKQERQAPTYITNPQVQKMMCEAAGVSEKPTAIPVTVIGNPMLDENGMPALPQSILWSRMAHYQGGKCVCSCSEFGADGKGKASRRVFERKTSGQGDRTKEYFVLARTDEITCDPATCPLATGDHDQLRYKGTPLCKPQVTLSVGLPWHPTRGTVAKFKTTGWHSYYALRDSLLTIAAGNNGWLHDLPNLWLVLDWERAGNGQLVPSVRIEFRGSDKQLRAATEEIQGRWVRQEAQLKQLQAGVAEVVAVEEDKPEEQVAHQREFAPELANERLPVIDGDFEEEPAEVELEEPQGEDLELRPPPVSPASINNLADFEAALLSVGCDTAEKLSSIKDQLGITEKRLGMTVEQYRQIYSIARQDWEAANA